MVVNIQIIFVFAILVKNHAKLLYLCELKIVCGAKKEQFANSN